MLIKVMADSGRRIAWTDRKNGYFQFLFSKKNNENGYFRGNTKFLDGFASFGKGLDESEFTEVFPYGFKSVFKNSFIEAALLLEEQAFYLNSNAELGILNLVQFFFVRRQSKKASCTTFRILPDNFFFVHNIQVNLLHKARTVPFYRGVNFRRR